MFIKLIINFNLINFLKQIFFISAPVSAPPSKRPASAPISKGNAIRSRGPSKSSQAALPTTQRPAAPAKRPVQLQPQLPQQQAPQEEEQEAAAPLNQSAEESNEDDSQDGF